MNGLFQRTVVVAAAVLIVAKSGCCIQIITTNVIQVGTTFYPGFGKCLLESLPVLKASPQHCFMACEKHPECLLSCFNDTTCSLYMANVAPYYDPSELEVVSDPYETFPGKCYTSWIYKNDISHLITSVTATPEATVTTKIFHKELGIDGYHCDIDPKYLYHSIGGQDHLPYFMVSFDNFVMVSEVLIVLRGANSFFNYIEVRVGNSSCTGISCDTSTFAENKMIGTRYGSIAAPDGVIVKFDGSSSPAIGKHVIVNKMELHVSNFVIVGEIKVIGKVLP